MVGWRCWWLTAMASGDGSVIYRTQKYSNARNKTQKKKKKLFVLPKFRCIYMWFLSTLGSSSVLALIPTQMKHVYVVLDHARLFRFASWHSITGLISKGFANDNHLHLPLDALLCLEWQNSPRVPASIRTSSLETIPLVLYSRTSGRLPGTNNSKHNDVGEKSWRNRADALLEHFYHSTGSLRLSKLQWCLLSYLVRYFLIMLVTLVVRQGLQTRVVADLCFESF